MFVIGKKNFETVVTSKKALAHPKDHLERSLRPIQATVVTPGPFWTRQKRLETYFLFKEPHNSLGL